MSRTEFNESWLMEMPMGTLVSDTYKELENNINELIKSGIQPISIKNNLFKIVGNTMAYYWYEDGDAIALATQLERKPQAYIICLTGKNPNYKGKPPYASDLYDAILNDVDRSIVLKSDVQLSDEGYAIWKKLFDLGHKVSVYNRLNPGQTFRNFNSKAEMDQYFKNDDRNFKKYQFVLSETTMLIDTIGVFGVRRYRELSGLDLED